MTLRESDVTQALDDRGLHDDARGPGVYALRLAVPGDVERVRDEWDGAYDARPGNDGLERIAHSSDVAYVGASTNVYERLCEHATGSRQPSVLGVFDPTEIVDIWPHPDPFETAEWHRALRLARDGWVTWVDGEVLG